MTDEALEKLKYPIGKYKAPSNIDSAQMTEWVSKIESFPARLREATEGLTEEQLDTRYRPEGWTLRQVVHHLADSHINAYTRYKLAMTEKRPIIKPYYEDRWAELPEAKNAPIEISLKLLEGVHGRWATALRSLSEEDGKRRLIHPDADNDYVIDSMIGMYVWHGNHHLGHILETKKRM